MFPSRKKSVNSYLCIADVMPLQHIEFMHNRKLILHPNYFPRMIQRK